MEPCKINSLCQNMTVQSELQLHRTFGVDGGSLKSDPETGEPVFNGPTNGVTVLQHDGQVGLDEVGKVDGIAPGETIWSARFIGERGYLVTFETIDPLWVIDLSDPTNPTILGELEVLGSQLTFILWMKTLCLQLVLDQVKMD